MNSEQLLFNWQLGRDLVIRKAEKKWGAGIVEQLSLDLQAEFPNANGFSARNLWNMKKWYSFYSLNDSFESTIRQLDSVIDISSQKLQQVAAVISETSQTEKLQQSVAEIQFPSIFGFVPWGHHVLIITKCKTIEEAAFYLKRTVDRGLSRKALDDCIRADLYHTSGGALTNFDDKLPDAQSKIAQEILKSNYDLVTCEVPDGLYYLDITAKNWG